MALRRCERCHFAFELAEDGEPVCPQCGSTVLAEPLANGARAEAKTLKMRQVPLPDDDTEG